MDTSRDGSAINRPPFFDGNNYAHWKRRMRAFLKSLDERVWMIVEDGWNWPQGEDGQLKPRSQWTELEYTRCNHNSKGLNAMFNAVSSLESNRIIESA